MTVVPPGLLHPVDPEPGAPSRRRPRRAPLAGDRRWTVWSTAFVALVSLTVVALVVTVADLAGG